MANVLGELFSDIAVAIREKTGETATMKPAEFSEKIAAIEVGGGGSDVPFTTITVTAKRANVALPGATVTAVNGKNTVTGVTGEDGKCVLIVTVSGTWSITVTKDGGTYTTSSYVSLSQYTATASLFYATITVACEIGATITLTKPDGSVMTETATSEKTTYTVYSSGTYNATVEYNGETKTKTFSVSSTTGAKYSVNLYVTHLILEDTSWDQISLISAEGNAANYFAVGDTKAVALNGTVGSVSVNATYYVYIIGINHNADFEGSGIHFGCFKTASGTDIALVDSSYGSSGGTFRMSKNGSEYWWQSDLRINILGSTGSSQQIGSATELTASYKTDGTLMGVIPSELRNVMKPVTKYSAAHSGNTVQMHRYMKEYFTLPNSYEMTGSVHSYVNSTGNAYKTYCRQYEYYANGASKIKYKHNAQTTACIYWIRDRGNNSANYSSNLCITESGGVSYKSGNLCYGLAPIFMV